MALQRKFWACVCTYVWTCAVRCVFAHMHTHRAGAGQDASLQSALPEVQGERPSKALRVWGEHARVPADGRLSPRRPGPLPAPAHAHALRCDSAVFLTRGGLLPIPPKSGPARVCLDRETAEGTSCEFRADLRGLSVPSCPWGPPGEAASWKARSHARVRGQSPGPQTSKGYSHHVGGSFRHSQTAWASSQQGVGGCAHTAERQGADRLSDPHPLIRGQFLVDRAPNATCPNPNPSCVFGKSLS